MTYKLAKFECPTFEIHSVVLKKVDTVGKINICKNILLTYRKRILPENPIYEFYIL